MELAGFVVGIFGIALSVAQYMEGRRNKRTLRNWGASIVTQHKSASRNYQEAADRVAAADREQWRSMHPEILSILRRSATDASNTAEQITLYIETITGDHARRNRATDDDITVLRAGTK
ncbi:MAG: hypothetical protein ACRDTG_30885 [Pseudonocardiaceae bacterium]